MTLDLEAVKVFLATLLLAQIVGGFFAALMCGADDSSLGAILGTLAFAWGAVLLVFVLNV